MSTFPIFCNETWFEDAIPWMYNRGSGLHWNSSCQLLMIYVIQEDLLFRKLSLKSRTCITIEKIKQNTMKQVKFGHIEEWSESEH